MNQDWVPLSRWAEAQGISYRTAVRRFHADELPGVELRREPSGRLFVRLIREGGSQLDRIEGKLDLLLEAVGGTKDQ